MIIDRFSAVRACSIAILAGSTLQTENVSAGNGMVVDWREVPSGVTLLFDTDAFDTANLFVDLVGFEAAFLAATRDRYVAPAPDPTKIPPRISAFAPQGRNNARRRSFEVGAFRVFVEPADADETDAAQADFTARLAALAATLA